MTQEKKLEESELKESELKNSEIEEEEDEDEDLSQERKIHADIGDREVQALYNKYKKGRLNVQPDFQRHFVWDEKKSSRLIESALLGIPLPVVYLSEDNDGKNSVIDGQQRLTSFFYFIDGNFKLSGLKVFRELNRKKYSEISEEYQEKINECEIRTITFSKESDSNLKFEIFDRLNSGSVALNAQELRNCVYRGSYNDLLRKLSRDKEFIKLMEFDEPHKRMWDVELVLRFSTFYFQGYLNYPSQMKRFMNDEMEKRSISDDDAKALTFAFKQAVSLCYSMLGENAFLRFVSGDDNDKNGGWLSEKFNTSLYEILMWSFARVEKNAVMSKLDAIREAFIDLMTSDKEFMDSIEKGTNAKNKVVTRFDKWRMALDKILEDNQPRCFSRQIKEELYEQNPTCQLCGNRIISVDDAAVDHIEQYWLGGKTIPENARLTHRYCNAARPRKE